MFLVIGLLASLGGSWLTSISAEDRKLPSVIYASNKELDPKPILRTLVMPRFSTSDIPECSSSNQHFKTFKMEGIDYSSNVPHPIYNHEPGPLDPNPRMHQYNEQTFSPSPPLSP